MAKHSNPNRCSLAVWSATRTEVGARPSFVRVARHPIHEAHCWPGSSISKRQPCSQLNCSRLVVLRGIDAAEARVIGVRIGSTEAGMVERIERVEAKLEAGLYGRAEV